MMETLWMNQPTCLCTYLFPPCSAAYLRYVALDRDMSRYSCCQGYMDNPCFRSGKCGEKSCPEFCLCMEVFCCLGPSVSSTRMMVMDQYEIRPDPCDNRLIRFTNCLLVMSCVCDLLSICYREIRHLAHLLHTISNCVAYTTIGCMASQVFREIAFRREFRDEYANWADGDHLNSPILAQAVPQKDEKYPL
jgi:hypothetical protein